MTSGYEPVLHALSAEPRMVRPGETVRLAFRTRNFGSTPSPSAVVRFILPAGLEAIDAAGATQDEAGAGSAVTVTVGSTGPGEDVSATIAVRVCRPMDDGTQLDVQALLEAGESVLGTNVCRIGVRSCPLLNGAESGTFIDALDDGTVRVRAVVTNEGDGPARDVRITLPAPIGTVALDPRTAGTASYDLHGARTVDVARIDAGESVSVAFDARIVEPVAVVCADEAFVSFADGRRCAILARTELVVEAQMAPPVVSVTRGRRQAGVAVTLRNAGWADARDVHVRIRLPAAVRMREGSATLDGVPVPVRSARRRGGDADFARIEKADGAAVVVIDRVAAQSAMRVELIAGIVASSPACISGDVVAQVGSDEPVTVPLTINPVREVRVRIVGAPRRIAEEELAAIVVEVVNLGDTAESLTISANRADARAGTGPVSSLELPSLEPGRVALATLVATVPILPDDATSLCIDVSASDADGVRARAEHTVAFRKRPAVAQPVAPAVEERSAPAETVRGVVSAPATVVAGTAFRVTATVEVDAAVETLAVFVREHVGVRYVPGSTRVDGCTVLDRDGRSPLEGDGLTLRGVPGGSAITFAWSLFANGANDDPAIRIDATAVADETIVQLAPAAVVLREGPAFAVRAPALAYHIDAQTATAPDAVPERAEHTTDTAEEEVITRLNAEPPAFPQRPAASANPISAPEWSLHLTPGRAEAIARAMRGAGGNTLVSHLVALRVLLPDVDETLDVPVVRALSDVRNATREVYDRLYVKLRIPGFDATAADLEDAELRSSLVALYQRLSCSQTEPVELAHSPLGSPDALRALAALIPVRCDDNPLLAAALRFYRCALDEALAQLGGAATTALEAALMHDAGFLLEDARAAVLAESRAATMLLGAA